MSCDPHKLCPAAALVPLCPTGVMPAHSHQTFVTRRDTELLSPGCDSSGFAISPCSHTELCRGIPGTAQGCIPVTVAGLSLAPPKVALPPREGRGWGRGWLLTQRGITAPSAARALQWVALCSPESRLKFCLLGCLGLFLPSSLLCLSLLGQPCTEAATEQQ